MCGFVGFLGGTNVDGHAGDIATLTRMADTISHRGPDDSGCWADVERRIGLAHRRLAIVDLSPAGHQPMESSDGRYIIAFNGEIYNHMDLRAALAERGSSPAWRGHSDTETLLAGFEAWGVRGTLERATGMFAFALWDRQAASLVLGRDRFGEKPLYYGWQGEGRNAVFLFGSELKALRAHPTFVHEIDRGALSLQLTHNYIPAPYSIYKGIRKLQPGTFLTLSLARRDGEVTQFWNGVDVAQAGISAPFNGTAAECVDELESLLMDAVRQQMMADVPLGAFLSGGIDSSTIVALMQAQSKQRIKTFSIGFDEVGYNEAEHAKAVAVHLGTDHTELYVTAAQSIDVIPKLPQLYDEPFSDSSQIPTFLVSELAKSKVTVSLSGDAGDELFCGYNRYKVTSRLWGTLARTPAPLKHLAAQTLISVSPGTWDRLGSSVGSIFRRGQAFSNMGDKLHKGAGVLASKSCAALYLNLISHWRDSSSIVLGATDLPTLLNGNEPKLGGADNVQRMMMLDMLTYLPDDILVKVDRAAMAVALETRVPFLDHRVVEFAWRLPQEYKLRDGQTKWALRQVLYKHVPRALIERPKMGFAVPIGSWLRGSLREWAEDLLSEERLRRDGFFAPEPIRKKWSEHLSGKRNWQYDLWDVLMFQSWFASTQRSS